MANMHLVTGYAGQEHVTAADHGAFNAALIGTGQFVLAKGSVFEAQVITNNQIRILDGELMMQGRFVRLDPGTYIDLTIDNGAQGMKRNDLIVARYTKNTSTAVEAVDLVVIKGTAAASNPVDPSYTEGDVAGGTATLNDFPLWRIPIDGLNVGTPEMLFEPFIDSLRTLPEIRQQVLNIHAEVDAQLAEQDAEITEKIAGIESYLKEETLTNATKALFGLEDSAVPDDVLRILSNALFNTDGKPTDIKGDAVGVQIATGSYVGTNTDTEVHIGFKPGYFKVWANNFNVSTDRVVCVEQISDLGYMQFGGNSVYNFSMHSGEYYTLDKIVKIPAGMSKANYTYYYFAIG